jgi:hypothetical protein
MHQENGPHFQHCGEGALWRVAQCMPERSRYELANETPNGPLSSAACGDQRDVSWPHDGIDGRAIGMVELFGDGEDALRHTDSPSRFCFSM